MFPILIYSNTLVYTPHYIFVVTIFYALYRKQKLKARELFSPLTLSIFLIVLLSTFNFYVHLILGINQGEIIPFTILMFGTYLIAISLSRNDLQFLVYLIALECLVGFAQFFLGVKTFFTGIENFREVADSSLLYFRSVYGLSENSSAFSIKIILAYLLTYFLGGATTRTWLVRIILLGGLVVSFNRSSIFAIIFFHGLQFATVFVRSIIQFLRLRLSKTILYAFVAGIIVIGIGLFYLINNFTVIFDQLTRGTKGIELTGRELIWGKYVSFISNHFWVGNGSFKYYADYHGGPIHAHNSFLQMLATHGCIIFCFYIALIAFNINKNNFLYLFPLLMYSMAQYGIFWGISLTDIIFFVFLTHDKVRKSITPKENAVAIAGESA